eukprot:CAMPEP_0172644380 /NCGR_PEP_ID=MMETSP1068-20121228/239181_1 /TAXON_ID=35684 /ORGANISM="Pseudopedinella elastica, Strain CCMP716" /LENGTH=211 /DNA_ID=CAMNT_0013458577 /DNA_START=46 /DNA_END=681 /DNA_ORIENTATION=+
MQTVLIVLLASAAVGAGFTALPLGRTQGRGLSASTAVGSRRMRCGGTHRGGVGLAAAVDDAVGLFKAKFDKPGTPFGDVPAVKLVETFSAIAALYGGDENALKMVQAVPNILTYDAPNLAPAKAGFMRAFAEPTEGGTPPKYTEQDVIDMVIRNPLLLGLRDSGFGGTENSGEDTMAASYVIAATRDQGGLLLGGLIFLLTVPVLKAAAGM